MSRTPASWPRALWILLGVAFGIRAAAWMATWSMRCILDECFYTELATALAHGEGFQAHSGHYWPPGYIAFLAAHIRIGVGTAGAKAVQVLLSTLLVALSWEMGRRAAAGWGTETSRRVGLASAALVALDPTLIAYSHYLWSETLFLPLFVGALLLSLDAAKTGSPQRAALAGLLLGLGCLIKVLPVYFAPVLALWIWWHAPEESRPHRAALALLAASLLAIVPWSVRNTATYGHFVLIETTTGKNLVRGNNASGPANWDWGTPRRPRGVLQAAGCSEPDPISLDACLKRSGLQAIAGHPGRFLRQAGTKLADLFNPTSFLVRHIRRGIYGQWPAGVALGVILLVAAFNVTVIGLGTIGWIHGPAGPLRRLVLLFTFYTLAVHVVTFAMSRFRLPLEPFLAVGTALVLAAPVKITERLRAGRLRWITAGILLLLVVGWSLRLGWLFAVPQGGQPPGPTPSSGVEEPRPTALAAPPITARLITPSKRVGPGTMPASRPVGELNQRSRRHARFNSPTHRDRAAMKTARAPTAVVRGSALPWRRIATTRPTSRSASTG